MVYKYIKLIKEEENENEIINGEDFLDEKIKFPEQKRKFNDFIFGLIFLAQFILFLVILIFQIISINKYNSYYSKEYTKQSFLFTGIALPIIILIFFVWKKSFKNNPLQIINYSFYAMFILGIPSVIVLYWFRYYTIAIIYTFLIIGLGNFYFRQKDKIPFASQVILVSMSIIENYQSTVMVSISSLVLLGIYINIWIFTYVQTNNIGLIIFLWFSFFWTNCFIRFASHTSISGLIASWYYFSKSGGNEFSITSMANHPMFDSILRTLTTSFGTISLGSLIIAIIDLISQLFNMVAGLISNPCISSLFQMSSITVKLFRNMYYSFNLYSFCMVSIYGKSFFSSCKNTLKLMKTKGTLLFVSMNYISITLFSISLLSVLVTGIISTLITYFVGIHAISINFQISMFIFIMYKPYDTFYSSCITLLMCLISDPNVLKTNNPKVYNQLVSYWPDFEQIQLQQQQQQNV